MGCLWQSSLRVIKSCAASLCQNIVGWGESKWSETSKNTASGFYEQQTTLIDCVFLVGELTFLAHLIQQQQLYCSTLPDSDILAVSLVSFESPAI